VDFLAHFKHNRGNVQKISQENAVKYWGEREKWEKWEK